MDTLIDKAFALRPRRAFLPDDVIDYCEQDAPFPIGYGQTNSQPSLVYKMLELLDVKPGHKILDVGCGSGWTTSLLGVMVGPSGYIVGTERIPELASFASSNCKKFAFSNIKIVNTVDQLGFAEEAPYDRILVSAGSTDLPTTLINQLNSRNGKMIIPIKGILTLVTKKHNKINIKPLFGVVFVPLVH